MSERQEQKAETVLEGIEEGDIDEISDRIARNTMPGDTNEQFISTICEAEEAVRKMDEDLNSWFEILDVRIYPRRVIGVPARFRWTIKRWVHHDMDQWLLDNGWEWIAHRKADSDEHEENEMEARYRKDFEGFGVHCNFYVEFTEDVFESLEHGDYIHRADMEEKRRERVEEMREERRRRRLSGREQE